MAIKRLSGAGVQSRNGKSSKVWDQSTAMGAYESIATAVVTSGGASSITFSNIPQTYMHLQLRATFGFASGGDLRFNGDTTAANYRSHWLWGNGSSTYGQTASNAAYFPIDSGDVTSGSYRGAAVMDILDYTSKSKNKVTRTLEGNDNNGSGNVWFYSNLWMNNTDAIVSLTFSNANPSYPFPQYSHFALYGIRG